mgnify:CR=1 FL=1|jgi:hypothetical protein
MGNPKEETTLKVSFPNEKLEALRFYMAEKELTVEGELQKFVDNIYQKYIPAPTRRYLDRDDKEEGGQTEVINKYQKTTAKKRTAKAKDTMKEEGNAASKTKKTEEATEQSQGENQAMTMSM